MKRYFIYHAFCPDGFGAAYAYWKKYGDEVTYIPVSHGQPFPEIEDGSSVVIADFSFKRDVLLTLEKRFKEILLLDHHTTAQDDLEGISYAKFDMNRSGAVIVWEEFFPGTKVPSLLKYVEDRDLWNFKLESSHEVSSYIGTVEYTFLAWDKLAKEVESNFENVVKIGSAILKREHQLINSVVADTRIVEVEGHKVPAANSSVLHSDVAHKLLTDYKDNPFAVVWNQKKNGDIKISLRSRGDFDVSKIAKKYGGGGHKAAAGCKFKNIP